MRASPLRIRLYHPFVWSKQELSPYGNPTRDKIITNNMIHSVLRTGASHPSRCHFPPPNHQVTFYGERTLYAQLC